MKYTRLGKYCYAIGSNPESARLSGIKTDKHVIKIFIIEGVLAAIAGILLMSNLNVGGPNEGQGLDLLAMAAAIMGGTQFSGGVGTVGGAIVGIFHFADFHQRLGDHGRERIYAASSNRGSYYFRDHCRLFEKKNRKK
jgi:ribose/xylose/arabinose/galactoside ABC-type transport system permease subunit